MRFGKTLSKQTQTNSAITNSNKFRGYLELMPFMRLNYCEFCQTTNVFKKIMQAVEMSKNLTLSIYPPVYQTACLPASLSISVFLTICMSISMVHH